MDKLLAAYAAAPTAALAEKIRCYNLRHPMAACMLLPSQIQVLRSALMHGSQVSA